MDSVLQDLKYALRTLRRAPAFSAAAALAIAVGVGGSSAMFSVLEGVVLRPLGAPQPDRLVRLYEVGYDGNRGPWSPPDFLDLSKENSGFEAVGAIRFTRVSMTTDAGPQQLPAVKVNAGFFAALGVQPARARDHVELIGQVDVGLSNACQARLAFFFARLVLQARQLR